MKNNKITYVLRDNLFPGMYIDVRDRDNVWKMARIIDEKLENIIIRLDGYDSKYNQIINQNSSRIAPFRRHSEGYTGPSKRTVREQIITIEIIEEHKTRLNKIIFDPSGEMQAQDINQYLRGQLFIIIDSIMTYQEKLTNEEIIKIHQFFEEIIIFIIRYIQNALIFSTECFDEITNSKEAFLTNNKVAYVMALQQVLIYLMLIFGVRQQDRFKLYARNEIKIVYKQSKKESQDRRSQTPQQYFKYHFNMNYGSDWLKKIITFKDLNSGKGLPACIRKFSYIILKSLKQEFPAPIFDLRDYQQTFKLIPTLIEVSERNQIQDVILEYIIGLIFNQSAFEGKIRGVIQLREIIQNIEKKNYPESKKETFSEERILSLLKKSYFLDFLSEKNSYNSQIFKRSLNIIRFMADQKILKDTHIDGFFKLCQNQESEQGLLYGMIVDLTKYVTPDLLDHIFLNFLKNVTATKWSEFLVNSIKDFTISAIQNLDRQQGMFFGLIKRKKISSKYGYYGLDLFWKEIQDQSKCDAKAIPWFLDALKKMFSKDCFLDLRESFMELCLNNLAKKKSCGQSLKLLTNILICYPVSKSIYNNGDVRSDMIQKYDKKYNLMEIIMLNLKNDDISKNSKISLIQTKEWLFQFLEQHNSNLKNGLKAQTIKSMWQIQSQNISPLLKYLRKIDPIKKYSRKQYFKLLPLQTIKNLFNQIFLSWELMNHYNNLSKDIYDCIDDLFLSFHNTNNIDISQSGIIRIINPNFKLNFIEFYEKVISGKNNAKLLESASKRLVELHARLRDTNDLQKKINMWSRFIEKWIGLLNKRDFNALKIIYNFLIEIEGKLQKGDIGGGVFIDLKIVKTQETGFYSYHYKQRPNDQLKVIRISKNSTIFKLRKMIMKEFGIITDFSLQLFENRKQFNFNQEEEYNVAFIEIPSKAPAVRIIKKLKMHTHLQALILFKEQLSKNENLYSLLVTLLDKYVELSDQIWKILDLLPKNEKLHKKLLNQPFIVNQWAQFLKLSDSGSFQYKLRNILQLLTENVNFARIFLATGGFDVLIEKLYQIKKVKSSNKVHSMICFRIMLDIISSCLNLDDKQLIFNLDSKMIIKNMCELVSWLGQQKDKSLIVINVLKIVNSLLRLGKNEQANKQFHRDILFLEELIRQGAKIKDCDQFDIFINYFFEIYSNYTQSEDRIKIVMALSRRFLKYDLTVSPTQTEFVILIQSLKKLTDIEFHKIKQNKETYQLILGFPIKVLLQENLSEDTHLSFNSYIFGALCIQKLIIQKEGYNQKRYSMLFDLFIQEFLFNQSNNRVKSDRNLQAVYGLLQLLLNKKPQNIKLISNFISSKLIIAEWRNLRDWTVDVDTHTSNMQKITTYCGLKNLSATCYINSLLQQFYMIQFFSQALIKVNTKDYNKNIDENWVYQLQRIFIFLKMTSKGFYNPKDFCAAFKDYENKPIDVRVQSDVDEFFNLFMDKLQSFLKEINQLDIIDSTIKGILINQVHPQSECNHMSEGEENFLSLRINIKNKSSLETALDAHFSDQILSGDNAYLCSVCKKKIPARKRQIIKNLPNIFVIALKRFEFNYDLMKKNKINDYCSFPLEGLDLKKYSKEMIQRNPQYYLYDLRGVIVHYGVAEGGHYYSYIKGKQNWVQFNDQTVTPFDQRMFESQCFGGIQKFDEFESEKCKNAYLLFYQRRHFYDKNQKINDNFPITLNKSNESKIIEEAIQDNRTFEFTKKVFQRNFLNFGRISFDLNNQEAVRFGFLLLHNVVLYSRHKQKLILSYCKSIDNALEKTSTAQWYLSQINKGYIQQFLIDAPKPVKYIVTGIILKAIQKSNTQNENFQNFIKILISCLQRRGMTPFCKIFSLISKTKEGRTVLENFQYSRRVIMHLCSEETYANEIKYISNFSEFGQYQPKYQAEGQILEFSSISLLESLQNFPIERSQLELLLEQYPKKSASKIISKIVINNFIKQNLESFRIQLKQITKIMKEGDFKEIQIYMLWYKQFLAIEDTNTELRTKEIVAQHLSLFDEFKITFYPFQTLLTYLFKFSSKFPYYQRQFYRILQKEMYHAIIIQKWIQKCARVNKEIYYGNWTIYKKNSGNAQLPESSSYYEQKSEQYEKIYYKIKINEKIPEELKLIDSDDDDTEIYEQNSEKVINLNGELCKMKILGRAGLLYHVSIQGSEKWLIGTNNQEREFVKYLK